LVATAGALGVGRLAPRLLNVAPAPYILLGCGYALLAVAPIVVGSLRHRAPGRAIERGEPAALPATTVTLFTVGGVTLAAVTTSSCSPRSSRAGAASGPVRQRHLTRQSARVEQHPGVTSADRSSQQLFVADGTTLSAGRMNHPLVAVSVVYQPPGAATAQQTPPL
jgi:hypothetical protein